MKKSKKVEEKKTKEKILIKSKKIDYRKTIRLVNRLMIVFLIIIIIFSVYQYQYYKEGQDLAVNYMLDVTNDFDSYKNNRSQMIKKMYNYLSPIYYNTTVNGININNSGIVSSASKINSSLGDLLTKSGYPCDYGSIFLKYQSYVDFICGYKSMPTIFLSYFFFLAIWGFIYFSYKSNRKSKLIVMSDKIIYKRGENNVKEFFIKDIKSVSTAPRNGIRIIGDSFKYQIDSLENDNELRKVIIDRMQELNDSKTTKEKTTKKESTDNNSIDEIIKYKELLDKGIITEEEFAKKKKDLLKL